MFPGTRGDNLELVLGRSIDVDPVPMVFRLQRFLLAGLALLLAFWAS